MALDVSLHPLVLMNLSDQFTKEIYGKIVEPTVQFRHLRQNNTKKEEIWN